MKKVLALILCLTLFLCMAACGSKNASVNSPNELKTEKTPDVSITIDGISYNEKEYVHYLDITVNNKTDKAIKGYDLSLYLNEYFYDSLLSFDMEANTTIKEQVKIERHWIIYYYNLCNMTEVDKASLTIRIWDKEADKEMGTVTASAEIEKYKFDESKFSVAYFNADINKKVYEDDKCAVTLLSFYEDYLKNPTAYFILENKNISDKIYMDYKRKKAESYDEILEDLNNGGETITAEINGKEVSCGKFVDDPGEEGLSKGKKAIIPVEIDVESAGISLQEIASMKLDFVIENQDTLNNIQYANFTIDWVR